MEKNLGHATAYGYAKSKGYSGTENEFAELMADYASVGQSAAQSAEQAAASATSASGSAATASQAAQTATSKASEAVTAADTATTKASEANTSAQSASQSATSASTSAQTATTKAGTATAKADEAAASEAAALSAKTDAESARDAAAQSASRAEQSAESIDPETLEHKAYGAYVVESASGAIASFADGADNIPMKDVLVHIEPVQEGSDDPSPDNIRPISGWTGCVISHSGADMTNPTTYSITFPTEAGTVYGGTLDVTKGELVVDRAVLTYNTANMNNGEYYPGWEDAKVVDIAGAGLNTIMEHVVTNVGIGVGVNTIAVPGVIFLPKKLHNNLTQSDWKALAIDIQIVLPLATPITYQLSPQEITSLLGTNNVWVDTGNTEVEYRADTRLYIEKLTQPEENDMIADSAINSGQFFMIGNSLYRALANIASGATITVGTNAERASLSDALNLVNA